MGHRGALLSLVRISGERGDRIESKHPASDCPSNPANDFLSYPASDLASYPVSTKVVFKE